MVLAALLGYDIREAASIGIIGAADGPFHRGGVKVCTSLTRANIRGSLFIHGISSHYSTTSNTFTDLSKRTVDQDDKRL